MTTQSELRVMFSKRRDPGVLWGRTWAQLVVLTGAGFSLIGAVRSSGGLWPWWILAAGLLLVVGFGRVNGRPLAEVLPAILADGVVRATGQHVYRGGPFRPMKPRVPDAAAEAAKRAGPVLPGVLSRLQFLAFEVESTGEPVGIVKDRRDGTYLAVLQVTGETYPLLDTETANSYALAFQRMIDGLARPDSPLVTLQLLQRVIPDQGDAVRREARVRAGHGNEFVNASYEALVSSEAGRGVRHESYVVLRIKPAKVRSAWKADGGGDQGAAALVYRLVAKLGTDLAACGVQVLGWLPPRGVAAVVRSAFDPAADAPVARRGGGTGDVVGGDAGLPSGVAPVAAEPFYLQRANSYVVHNDHFSRTWWITEYPRSANGVPVGFLQPLVLNVPLRHSISILLEPLPHRRAQRTVENQSSSLDASRKMDDKIGRRRKRAAQREEADVDRREVDLVEGYSVHRLATMVSLTCRTRQELEAGSELMESAMNECNMEAARWYVETDQAFAMAALPFGRGLR